MDIILLHERDNVAVSKVSIPAGRSVNQPNGPLTPRNPVPAMHKIALQAISKGEPIYKYGQIIGFASQDILKGDHVHTHNCTIGEHEKDYGFCRHARNTAYVGESQQAVFQGFRRGNGRVGTRNYIAVLTSVNCSATVARAIAAHFSQPGALADYEYVDGVAAFVHGTGCGMGSKGEDFDTLKRTLDGYACHPNFGGVLMVGLGCETMQVQRFKEECSLTESDSFRSFTIQNEGGTRAAIDKGIATIEEMLPHVNACRRETLPASELVLAVQCGGSDAFSGITANPALGGAGDILVRQGGTVIYSETPEIYGAEHLLTQRAATPAIAEQLLERIRWWEDYTRKNGIELNNNPSPGNKAGGLTTILEKSLGAQAKSGTTRLNGVYLYAQKVTERGLVFMDSPGFDPVSVTGQVASGANIVCFTTGRGSAFGYKPVPSIKLATNTALYERMPDDIDINCGDILDGQYTVAECGARIFDHILAIASGEQSKSEQLGYGDSEFTPWKLGAVV